MLVAHGRSNLLNFFKDKITWFSMEAVSGAAMIPFLNPRSMSPKAPKDMFLCTYNTFVISMDKSGKKHT